MAAVRWNQRFFASTRGRIVALLRRAARTVDELAQPLGLTDNAVRAHLATLERDGLVQQQGVRRGGGKPAYAYALTPEADSLFPKPYAQVLRLLLEELQHRLAPADRRAALAAVGRRLAAAYPPPTGDADARLDAAVAAINELGGLAEVERTPAGATIRGYSCPLAVAVAGCPEACHLPEVLLADLTGLAVRERCEQGAEPRCAFEVSLAPAVTPPDA